jgi:protein-tyrosine kinase
MNLIERAGRRLVPSRADERPVEAAGRSSDGGDAVPGPLPLTGDDAAIGREADDTSVRKASTRRRQTQRQINIDIERLSQMGYTVPGDQSTLAEEFRLIKRPVLDAAFARPPARQRNANLIMVTSSGPSEGKTFTTVNLAISMASEHDVRVLLIDADVVNPSIPTVLGFEAERGMVDVVGDPSIDLADVMIRTDIENLTLLSAGRFTPMTNELMASARMARFIDDICKRYNDRIIIFDSPPVLARSEPTVLARHVGQILFVVEAERTSRGTINDAIRLLDQSLVKIILNKAPAVLLREGFGQYGYYYNRPRTGSEGN